MKKLISKIYYINLDRRTDRRKFMEKQLNQFDIPFERFSAIEVDRDELLNENGKYYDYYMRCKTSPPLSWKQAIESKNAFRNVRGAIGCTISATELYKKLLKENHESNILILEDDCILKVGWYEILKDFFENNSEFALNFDILRNTWSQKNRKYLTKWNRDHKETKRAKNRKTNIYGGSHFTLVNKTKIKKIYDYLISDYVIHLDALYGTTYLNVYHAKFAGKVDYLRNSPSDCNATIGN